MDVTNTLGVAGMRHAAIACNTPLTRAADVNRRPATVKQSLGRGTVRVPAIVSACVT
jgi:hypothetical protein